MIAVTEELICVTGTEGSFTIGAEITVTGAYIYTASLPSQT